MGKSKCLPIKPSQAKPTGFWSLLGNNLKAGTVLKREPGSVGHIVSAGVTIGLMGPLVAGSVALTAAAWETCNAFKGILAPVRWLGKLSVGIVGGAATVSAFAGSLAASLVLVFPNYALSEFILNPALSLIQAARGKTMEAKDYLLEEDKKKLVKKDPTLLAKYFPEATIQKTARQAMVNTLQNMPSLTYHKQSTTPKPIFDYKKINNDYQKTTMQAYHQAYHADKNQKSPASEETATKLESQLDNLRIRLQGNKQMLEVGYFAPGDANEIRASIMSLIKEQENKIKMIKEKINAIENTDFGPKKPTM